MMTKINSHKSYIYMINDLIIVKDKLNYIIKFWKVNKLILTILFKNYQINNIKVNSYRMENRQIFFLFILFIWYMMNQ